MNVEISREMNERINSVDKITFQNVWRSYK